MKVFVLANQKGGVGKSFIASQFAFFLAHREKRVLMLDFDHQGNSSGPIVRSGLARVAPYGASKIFFGRAAALPEGPFIVVAGDTALSGLERQPQHHDEFVERVEAFLRSVSDQFDVCIIDTNPNPDIRYAAALIMADRVMSPVELNQEAIDGIHALLNHPRYGIVKLKLVMNPKLELIGILPNMVEATPFQRRNLAQLITENPHLLITMPCDPVRYAFIPTRTAIAEAQAAGVPLWNLRQAVAQDQVGKVNPLLMPVRTSAKDAWREIRPVFEEIERRLALAVRS